MIKNIIFDFGDVFINLDKPATERALNKYKSNLSLANLIEINKRYETGEVSTTDLLNTLQKSSPSTSIEEITKAWNAILLDFPKERFHFIQNLSKQKKYNLFLLSNTNEMHIEWIKNQYSFYDDFKSCFDGFYLSHEIGLRKPNIEIFDYVVYKNNLIPSETLFIDDTKENTEAASSLGIHTWNNDPIKEDVIHLFTQKSNLF